MARTYRREVNLSFSLVLIMMLVSLVSCDITKDKQECANQLVGLATCLPYVGNEAKAPTLDCCTGLKEVLTKSKKCLCVLVKDRNDPSLGLKINATLALGLPDKCHAPNGDVSECPALLHLSPNSPDAKVFSDFGKDNATPNSSSTAPATKTSEGAASATSEKDKSKNGGGGSKRWSIIQMFYVILASSCVLLHFI